MFRLSIFLSILFVTISSNLLFSAENPECRGGLAGIGDAVAGIDDYLYSITPVENLECGGRNLDWKDKDVAKELKYCAVKGAWEGVKGVGKAAWGLGKATVVVEKAHFEVAKGATKIIFRLGGAVIDPKKSLLDEARAIGSEKYQEAQTLVSAIDQSMPAILDHVKEEFEKMWAENACLTREQAIVEACQLISGELFLFVATSGVAGAIGKLRYLKKADDVVRLVDDAAGLAKRSDFMVVHSDNPAALALIRQNPDKPVMILRRPGTSAKEAEALFDEASKIAGRPVIEVVSESTTSGARIFTEVSRADFDDAYKAASLSYRRTTIIDDGIAPLGSHEDRLHGIVSRLYRNGAVGESASRNEMLILKEARNALGLNNHPGPLTEQVIREAMALQIEESRIAGVSREVLQFRTLSYRAIADYLIESLRL